MLSLSLGVIGNDGTRKENSKGLKNVEVLEIKSERKECCDGLCVCREIFCVKQEHITDMVG